MTEEQRRYVQVKRKITEFIVVDLVLAAIMVVVDVIKMKDTS